MSVTTQLNFDAAFCLMSAFPQVIQSLLSLLPAKKPLFSSVVCSFSPDFFQMFTKTTWLVFPDTAARGLESGLIEPQLLGARTIDLVRG
jgi:hypothetical protein